MNSGNSKTCHSERILVNLTEVINLRKSNK